MKEGKMGLTPLHKAQKLPPLPTRFGLRSLVDLDAFPDLSTKERGRKQKMTRKREQAQMAQSIIVSPLTSSLSLSLSLSPSLSLGFPPTASLGSVANNSAHHLLPAGSTSLRLPSNSPQLNYEEIEKLGNILERIMVVELEINYY